MKGLNCEILRQQILNWLKGLHWNFFNICGKQNMLSFV